jgi:hypothetical protein
VYYRRIVFVLVILMACFPLLGAGTGESGQQSVFKDGRIDYFEGEVTVNGSGAELNQTLKDKSTIATAAESLCDLVFNQKNIVHIGENSIFNVDMKNDPGTIEMGEGTALLVVKKLIGLKGKDDLTLRTSTAVLGVRGTSFFVKVEGGDSTYVCICNGNLHAEGADGSGGVELSAAHHKAGRFIEKDGSIEFEEATLLYHGDRDVEQAAAKIGVTIDWTKID